MFEMVRKIFLASLAIFIVLTTGAWQTDPTVLAASQSTGIPETPLYPDFTWSDLGSSTQDIRINVNGDSIAVSGERYQSLEQYIPSIHQDVLAYYSNEALAKSGWVSYDSIEGADGVQSIYYHESGVFLSVGFLACADVPSNTCVTVWKGEQTTPATATARQTPPADGVATLSSFGKRNPSDGQTNLNPANTTLSWEAYSPAPDKYAYCIKAGAPCPNNDPEWTSVFATSINLTNLAYNTTYYWQVRAVICDSCVPKTFVYANSGTFWTFRTRPPTSVVILGNVGVGAAGLLYTDGTVRTVASDATGAYSITVPFNWSGTITPFKLGYLFSPSSASFTNLTALQTIQNFIASVAYTISGNVGVAGIPLSYTNVTSQTVVSDASGNYSIVVPAGWSGTVTPSHLCYTFNPVNRPYTNIQANKPGENYAATLTGICVTAITRLDSNPTAASTVRFNVSFTRAATGVDSTDFSLTTSGTSGASIQSVTGSGTNYTVTVFTGTGNGTIRLDVVDNDSIKDASNNPLGGVGAGNGNFNSGEVYTISRLPTVLVNAVLPTSRSVQVGTTATVFNTVLNGGSATAAGVTLSMANPPAGTFAYQESNCATNVLVGAMNPTLDIPAGGARCYVLFFTPSAPFAATDVHIRAQATNAPATTLITGINTWTLRATSSAGLDIIALTTTTDLHKVSCNGTLAFAVALANVGAATSPITVTADNGSIGLPLSILVQETDPATGIVIGDNLLDNVGPGQTRTVVVWVTFNGCVNFDPAANRIFIRFRDGSNNLVGSTSTAVSTNR
jgi:hypothetical protein